MLAGGVLESRVHYRKWGEEERYQGFWSFYEDPRNRINSIYANIDPVVLIQSGEYSIEHIIPQNFLDRYLEKQPRNIRYGATINPFNMAPCHRALNNHRDNWPYDFHGDEITREVCIEIDGRMWCEVGFDDQQEWVIPVERRGDIARAMLHMCLVYEISVLDPETIETLVAWAEGDPPDEGEIRYNRWIKRRLGINNPLVAPRPYKGPRRLLADRELMRSVRK